MGRHQPLDPLSTSPSYQLADMSLRTITVPQPAMEGPSPHLSSPVPALKHLGLLSPTPESSPTHQWTDTRFGTPRPRSQLCQEPVPLDSSPTPALGPCVLQPETPGPGYAHEWTSTSPARDSHLPNLLLLLSLGQSTSRDDHSSISSPTKRHFRRK